MTKKHANTTTMESAPAFVEEAKTKPVEEENFEYTNLNNALLQAKKIDGVKGYILKSSTSATINLEDESKLTDYALATSAIMCSSQNIEKTFGAGKVENIIIEAKKTKTLCIFKGEYKICVFMKKETNHSDVLDKLESKNPR